MSLSVIAAGGADRAYHGSFWIWTYVLYLVENTKSLCSLPDYTKLYCRSTLLLSIRCRKLELTCKVLVLLRYFKISVPIRAAQRYQDNYVPCVVPDANGQNASSEIVDQEQRQKETWLFRIRLTRGEKSY